MYDENIHTFDMESDLILCRLAKTIACLKIVSKFLVQDVITPYILKAKQSKTWQT